MRKYGVEAERVEASGEMTFQQQVGEAGGGGGRRGVGSEPGGAQPLLETSSLGGAGAQGWGFDAEEGGP